MRLYTPLAAGLCLAFVGHASAATVAQYDFNTDGNTEGWSGLNNVANLTASNGALTGTASSNDPQLGHGSITRATASTWDTFSAEVRESDANGDEVAYDGGLGLVLFFGFGGPTQTNFGGPGSASAADEDGFVTLTWDISGYAPPDSAQIRFDPIGDPDTSGNSFQVNSITATDDSVIPEPASLALLGLGGLAMVARRRRHG